MWLSCQVLRSQVFGNTFGLVKRKDDDGTLPPGVATSSSNYEASSADTTLHARQMELTTEVDTSVLIAEEFLKKVITSDIPISINGADKMLEQEQVAEKDADVMLTVEMLKTENVVAETEKNSNKSYNCT